MLGSSIKQGVKEIASMAGYLAMLLSPPVWLIPVRLRCTFDWLSGIGQTRVGNTETD